MRVAIVHDYLTQLGGAERVLAALMELFPNAPVYTLLYNKEDMGETPWLDESRVRTSWLQNFPGAKRRHRSFPLLMPLAVEGWDFSKFDLVVSDTHSFTKGVITGSNTKHISYCFTPTRYAWDDSHRYVREFASRRLWRTMVPPALQYLRQWDYFAAQRVDRYVTLSDYVAQRIKKYYGHDATVIAPPVDVERFAHVGSQGDDEYYLVVSRLVPYKRVDLAIKACEQLGRRLKIAGIGPEEGRLRELARQYGERFAERTEFLGFVPDEELPALYAGARALLFPQEEDFGITPLEAAASGVPTIAYGRGGATETIKDGVTGMFFDEQKTVALEKALRQFEAVAFDECTIRQHAAAYGKPVFLDKMRSLVEDEMMSYEPVA